MTRTPTVSICSVTIIRSVQGADNPRSVTYVATKRLLLEAGDAAPPFVRLESDAMAMTDAPLCVQPFLVPEDVFSHNRIEDA